jgi:NADH-quinone oxidoreductase subunit H
VLIAKGCTLVFVQIWVRWTLPRLRIDQVMTTCLKYLVPISCTLFLLAVCWPLILASTFKRPVIGGRALGDKTVQRLEVAPNVTANKLASGAASKLASGTPNSLASGNGEVAR